MSLKDEENKNPLGDPSGADGRPSGAASLVVMTTCPDIKSADRLARGLVERRLAACVNLLPGVSSVYCWQGVIEESRETLLFIKTTQARYPAVEAFIQDGHPYELPEVIAVPIEGGSGAYLSWLEQQVLTEAQ